MQNDRGQTLILALYTIPVLLGALILFYYLSIAGHEQERAQLICDEAVMNSAVVQAQGLAAIARLNETARSLEILEIAMAGSGFAPAIKALKVQTALIQRKIGELTARRAIAMVYKTVSLLPGAQIASLQPAHPSGPHNQMSSLRLHIEPRNGSPQSIVYKLDADFESRQRQGLSVRVFPSNSIHQLMRRQKPNPISVDCGASVHMKKLEEKWTVSLNSGDRPLLKPH